MVQVAVTQTPASTAESCFVALLNDISLVFEPDSDIHYNPPPPPKNESV